MVNRLFPCVRRISQDLAKDLAILAREIHDVAGEIDSVSSSGTAPSTTVSTAATTPGSAIDTKEEVQPASLENLYHAGLKTDRWAFSIGLVLVLAHRDLPVYPSHSQESNREGLGTFNFRTLQSRAAVTH